jgi:hypothetical protein
MVMYKNVNGVQIQMSSVEETARLAEEKAWADGTLDRGLESIRQERNRLLVKSDYMGNSDVTMSSAWKTYRQALRDITNGLDTIDKINNVTWPTEPS